MARESTVKVNPGHVVHVHPEHGLHAPSAEELAANGVVTASAVPHGDGAEVKVPADVADRLDATGVATKG